MTSHSSGYKTSSDKFLYETVELSTLTHLFEWSAKAKVLSTNKLYTQCGIMQA